MASNAKTSPQVDNESAELSLRQALASGSAMDEKTGTSDDRANMFRMGKKQELRRNFRFISMFGFTMILMASWESIISVSNIGLVNGGTAGLIWIFFICWVAFIFINTSMAEMGSMMPTVGGQYHWVSEFAPRDYQKFISYLMGWLCVLGWQVLARKLPLIEAIILVIHIFAFFGILVTLWVLAPVNTSAKQVFTQFNDGGDWRSLGGSALIGITSGIYPLIGGDAAVHMSEELRDAGKTLPKCMIWTTVVNGGLAWIMAITFCFCVGDLEEVLNSPTGYPFMQVFYNAVRSTRGATAMSVFITIMFFFGLLTFVATSSRQLYAFARDKGLPFSTWFATVRPGWDIPFNALIFTFVFTSALSLINLGSATALNSITGLQINAMLSSYIVSIGCTIWRRCTNQPLLESKFSLGRWGLLVNIISMAFLVFFFILAFFPSSPHPDAASMNWNILIYGAVILLSTVYYMFWGKKHYDGPVEYKSATPPRTILLTANGATTQHCRCKGRRAQWLYELHKQYGPVVRVAPGEVSVADPTHYRTIYSNPKASHKDPGFYGAASFTGLDNIFQMVNREQHAARRKLVAAPYSLQSMHKLEHIIRSKSRLLADRFLSDATASRRGTVDAYELCALFSFELVCAAGFAKDFNSRSSALSVLRAMEISGPRFIFNAIFPPLKDASWSHKMPGRVGATCRAHNYWHECSRQMVREYLDRKDSEDIQDYLLAPFRDGVDGWLGRQLSEAEFVEEAMGIMLAGSGTTSSTLTYLIYAISQPQNQHVQDHLREEVLALSGTDDLAELRGAPYMNAVIKETLRLYPTIISTLPRILDQPIYINGMELPPGVVVGMQNYVHHRDPVVFPDPEAFRPERWLECSDLEGMEAALTPFSLGRRNCIGQNLAWCELYIGVSKILRVARLSLSSEMSEADMEMDDRFTIAPRGGKLMLEVSRL
ncbi:hypothetical protein FJTKL_01782 [Diaporthe vaccinii]|uniref:Uncharacterized protein n=1 Tax=Diaporthe vaccinii TaxID=105482 RepID=A0ABR4F494_9PEZI